MEWMVVDSESLDFSTCRSDDDEYTSSRNTHHDDDETLLASQPIPTTTNNLSDLPIEVLGHICKYLLRVRVFGKELANDLLPLLHTSKALHEKIYYNPFIWNEVHADLHLFVASYMPDNYSTTCFSVLCDEKFKNTDMVIGRFNGQFAYYCSVESELTSMFFSFVETLCDASNLIRNVKVPLPLISSYSPTNCSPSISFTNSTTPTVSFNLLTTNNSTTITDIPTTNNEIDRNPMEPTPLLKKWIAQFPNAKSLSFVSSNECVENARPNDLVPYVQDLSFYDPKSCKFQSLQEVQLSGSVNGFESIFKAHSSELQSLYALSVFSFTTKSKNQELQKIETLLQQCSNIKSLALANPVIVEPDNFNLFMTLSSRLTFLSLEVSFSFLVEGNDWRNLCHSLTNLKKLNLNIGSVGNDDSMSPTTDTLLKFSSHTNGIPLPNNITHLGLSNFMDSPISIVLGGCDLFNLTYLHAYKVLLSVTSHQKPFPRLETFEYMTEMRDPKERSVIHFWIDQHLSLKKFSYVYDWDNRALSQNEKTLVIKRHPTLNRLKLACDKSDVHIENAPSIISIIGVPNTFKLNGSRVQKLSFNICNTGASLHNTSIFDINLNQCDLFAVEFGRAINLSQVKFNSQFEILRNVHVTFSHSINEHQVFDVANILPMHSETLSLEEMKISFQDKLPQFITESLSNTLCQFNSIKEFTVHFAWLKTTIRGFSSQFKTLNVSNFLDVSSYFTKDEKNCRQVSNPHLAHLNVESEELGDFTTISCPSMTQLLCTSLNLKYSPHDKPARKIILDRETAKSLRDIKISFAQLLVHNIHNNIQLSHVQSLELTDPSLRGVEIDLQYFPNLNKLELSKIQSEIKIKAQGHNDNTINNATTQNRTPLHHANLQHVFINMVYSLRIHIALIAPKLRSFTLTNISHTHPESNLELVSTPKLIRKIVHLNLNPSQQ
ncbi:hypothetical protein C9374_007530 [Naegleria lovaniensis]|uniref:F-box domain-containing protein n=1 Tax=Naegleria lovaniensis TaxID=51637 RepID=A0AA88KIP4_NAELO|nr:uncharacterized protein C9374_007530 [Naegleria lovaniensis]KAG2379391.1 hypothetical protein C9374_007530 [Naegleria lovaniensis]